MLTGIVWEQYCACPVHIRSPLVSELGSGEFYQMMVMDGVVTKISSCEYVVTKK